MNKEKDYEEKEESMKTFLLGKRIYLRGLTPDEIKENTPYYSWLNDLSLDIYTERTYRPNTMENMETYYNRMNNDADCMLLGIFYKKTDVHIGNITFTEMNHMHRRACVGYLLGNKSYAGKGIMTDAVQMLMYFGFNKLNLERIHAGALSLNTASQRVAQKSGMVEEGTQRHYLLRNGQWHDNILFSAIRDEWMEKHADAARECFEELPV